jgi:hypothetical protein
VAQDCGVAIIESFGHVLDAWATGVEQGQVLVFSSQNAGWNGTRRIDNRPRNMQDARARPTA